MELECIVGLYWLEDSKNVWYFEPMLQHIVFICHTFPSNKAHVWVCVVFWTALCVIHSFSSNYLQSRLEYDD